VPVDLECLGRDLPVGPHHRGVRRPFRCVAPGSHRVIESYARAHPEGWFDAEGSGPPPTGLPEIDLGDDVQLTLRAGDIVLAHYQLAYSATPNLSLNIRYAVYYRLEHRETHSDWSSSARRGEPSDPVENAATEPRRRVQRHCGYGGARLASLGSRCSRETAVWELGLPHDVPARREDFRRRSAARVAGGVDESWWPVKVSPVCQRIPNEADRSGGIWIKPQDDPSAHSQTVAIVDDTPSAAVASFPLSLFGHFCEASSASRGRASG
jgi:hypothetical protein